MSENLRERNTREWRVVGKRGGRKGDEGTGSKEWVVKKPNHIGQIEDAGKGGGITLFVDYLPKESTNKDLWKIFQKHGKITDAFIPKKTRKGAKSRFGFVRYAMREEAERAIRRKDGAKLGVWRLKVNEAKYARVSLKKGGPGSRGDPKRVENKSPRVIDKPVRCGERLYRDVLNQKARNNENNGKSKNLGGGDGMRIHEESRGQGTEGNTNGEAKEKLVLWVVTDDMEYGYVSWEMRLKRRERQLQVWKWKGKIL